MTAALHSRLLAEYVARMPGARTTGFAAEVRRKFFQQFSPAELRDDSLRLVTPDAFLVDDTEREYSLTAVEITPTITARMLNLYLGIFWEVDAISPNGNLQLHLVRADGSVFAVDLSRLALEYHDEPVYEVSRLPGFDVAPPGTFSGSPRKEERV